MQVVLSSKILLICWTILVLLSAIFLVVDLKKNNYFLGTLMKWVWFLTVIYSGPLGLMIYWFSGRGQISKDSIWRKSFRSVAHCYSGCGAGEIIGIFITVGLLSLGNLWTSIITFILAYILGYTLTVGPLMEEGVSLARAIPDAFYSETASIAIMEITAIGVDLSIAGKATMAEPLFWSSLFFSLSIGLVAAYPVNVILIKLGIKEGMHDPRHMMKNA